MRFAVVLLALTAGACSPTWEKAGATREEFNRDTYECQKDSYVAGGGAIYVGGGQVRSTPNMGIYRSCMAAKGYSAH